MGDVVIGAANLVGTVMGAAAVADGQDDIRLLLDDALNAKEARQQAQLGEREQQRRRPRLLAEGILDVLPQRLEHLRDARGLASLMGREGLDGGDAIDALHLGVPHGDVARDGAERGDAAVAVPQVGDDDVAIGDELAHDGTRGIDLVHTLSPTAV